MLEVIEAMRVSPSVNVSPLAQSTPNIATMSPQPGLRDLLHLESACMRTSRPTLTLLPVRC
jgi:hypothetical protein